MKIIRDNQLILFHLTIIFASFPFLIADNNNAATDNTGGHNETPKYLDGLHLKISASQVAPFTTYKLGSDGNYVYSGILVELFTCLSRSLRFTYEYINEDPKEVALYGQALPAINQLTNKKVDLLGFPFTMNLDRGAIMDFSTYQIVTEYALMVPYPVEESRIDSLIRPFEARVWLTYLFSVLAVILLMNVIQQSDYHEVIQHRSFLTLLGRNAMYTLSIASNHSNRIDTLSNKSTRIILAFRILLGSWLLMMIVLVNTYASCLTALMTVTKLEPIVVNSLEELANSNKVKITVAVNTVPANTFLNATKGTMFRALGDSLRRNPHLLMTRETEQAVDNVLSHQAAYLAGELMIQYVMAQDRKKSSRCRLTISQPVYHSQTIMSLIGLTKGAVYNKAINDQVLYLYAFGFPNAWQKSIIPIKHCDLRNKKKSDSFSQTNSGQQRSIKLKDLAGSFLILGIGFIFGFFIFLLETIVSVCKDNRFEITRSK